MDMSTSTPGRRKPRSLRTSRVGSGHDRAAVARTCAAGEHDDRGQRYEVFQSVRPALAPRGKRARPRRQQWRLLLVRCGRQCHRCVDGDASFSMGSGTHVLRCPRAPSEFGDGVRARRAAAGAGLLSPRSRQWRLRPGSRLPCQPRAEQRSQRQPGQLHPATRVCGCGRARAGMRAVSMPSTTADASSQPRTGAPRFSGDEQPEPQAEVAGADHAGEEARRRPRTRHGRSSCAQRIPAPGSDTTPMATLPPAKLTARSLPSIDRIVRDQRSSCYVADGELKADRGLSAGRSGRVARLSTARSSAWPLRMRARERGHRSYALARSSGARASPTSAPEQEARASGAKGIIGGDADDDADRQAHHGAKRDGGSDAHGRALGSVDEHGDSGRSDADRCAS